MFNSRNSILIIVLAIFLLFGCTGNQTNTGTQTPSTGRAQTTPSTNGTSPVQTTPATGEGTIYDVGNNSGVPAQSQADCATLSPDCGSCLSKPGCGWCKSKNGCFFGGKPSDCQPSDWTTSVGSCTAPVGNPSCSSQTNCPSCLSGSGCQWCIDGSKCTSVGSSDTCPSGYLSTSFQCNYATR